MKVGNASTKYDFSDRNLDDDISNKKEVQKVFLDDFKLFIMRDYGYHKGDGSISLEQKKQLIIKFFKDLGV